VGTEEGLMKITGRHAASFALTLALGSLGAASAHAYPQYSQNHDATNCRACHGDFRANGYISKVDGQNWGKLHDVHRQQMLNGDCETCHANNNKFPVLIDSSGGGNGLDALACVGCHGRAEDNTNSNPAAPHGYGAGLRQHHVQAGVNVCTSCHADADPNAYTPVGEDVLPPYYATPGSGHPNMPADSCNPQGSEDFAGDADGIDNDGDGNFDAADSDCGGGTGGGGTGGSGTGGSGTGGSGTGGSTSTSGTGGGTAGGGTGGGASSSGTGGASSSGTGGASSSGTGGASSSGTGGSATAAPGDEGGCGCRLQSREAPAGALVGLFAALGLLLLRRRRD